MVNTAAPRLHFYSQAHPLFYGPVSSSVSGPLEPTRAGGKDAARQALLALDCDPGVLLETLLL